MLPGQPGSILSWTSLLNQSFNTNKLPGVAIVIKLMGRGNNFLFYFGWRVVGYDFHDKILSWV